MKTHCLYRHFDKDGRLLYVGRSVCAIARLATHRTQSKWFGQIGRVEIVRYPSKKWAAMAEVSAILLEKPMFNTVHSPTRQAAPARRPKGPAAEKRSISAPRDMFDDADSLASSRMIDNFSEYVRGLIRRDINENAGSKKAA